jgi:hypothetical protein
LVCVCEDKEENELVDLRSLGINPKRKTELNDKKELEELAENLKQSMLQDYKTAYGKKGKEYEAESKATVNP